MAGDGQSFCKKIRDVAETGNKEDAELMLSDAVPDPVKTHIQRLRHLDVDAVAGKVYGHLVVTEDWCWRLRVSHVVKYLTLVRRDSSGGEDPGVLGFGDERTDDGDTGAVRRDGMVERGVVAVVAKEMVAAGDASGTGA